MKATDLIDNDSIRDDIPDFQAGDELKVHVRVVEGGKERIQVFQGDVIGRQGGGLQETYTVRKLSYGVGVERTFPLHTPTVQKIEVVKRGDVRRAKLYYLRDRKGKAAKIREKRDFCSRGSPPVRRRRRRRPSLGHWAPPDVSTVVIHARTPFHHIRSVEPRPRAVGRSPRRSPLPPLRLRGARPQLAVSDG